MELKKLLKKAFDKGFEHCASTDNGKTSPHFEKWYNELDESVLNKIMTKEQIINEAKKKLPDPNLIKNNKYMTPVFIGATLIVNNKHSPNPYPIKIVSFIKVTNTNGDKVWQFKSID